MAWWAVAKRRIVIDDDAVGRRGMTKSIACRQPSKNTDEASFFNLLVFWFLCSDAQGDNQTLFSKSLCSLFSQIHLTETFYKPRRASHAVFARIHSTILGAASIFNPRVALFLLFATTIVLPRCQLTFYKQMFQDIDI